MCNADKTPNITLPLGVIILPENNHKYLDFANILTNASGEILRKGFKAPVNIEQKTDSSPVTQLDIAVEKCLRDLIERQFPDHGIVGEELGNIRENSEYIWVIDPIDGTRSFIAGYPIFTTLIALLHNGKPILGLIDQPILHERWAAISGEKTLYNNSILPKLTNKHTLAQASITTTSTNYFTKSQAEIFAKLSRTATNTVFGGDGYAYAMLASGRLDIVLDTGMKPYDFCALSPIIEGVGGKITDWAGKPLTLHSDGSAIAAASSELHAEILGFL